MWKGLVPLLTVKRYQKRVLKILLQEFDQCMQQPDELMDCTDSSRSDDTDTDIDDENEINKLDWIIERIQLTMIDECSKIESSHSTRQHLSLMILPPNPLYECVTYSRIPSNSPTSWIARRLIYNENNLIRLTSLSAYISTLGGGFFLCRYLSTAVAMARQQCRIALMRGDVDMAFKCRINEGYCYIHAGKLNRGKKIIKCVLYDIAKLQKFKVGIDLDISLEHEESELAHTSDRQLSELTVLRNMCTSALRFANLIKQQKMKEAKAKDETQLQCQSSSSATHDDFQRIRVVKNIIWKL